MHLYLSREGEVRILYLDGASLRLLYAVTLTTLDYHISSSHVHDMFTPPRSTPEQVAVLPPAVVLRPEQRREELQVQRQYLTIRMNALISVGGKVDEAER